VSTPRASPANNHRARFSKSSRKRPGHLPAIARTRSRTDQRDHSLLKDRNVRADDEESLRRIVDLTKERRIDVTANADDMMIESSSHRSVLVRIEVGGRPIRQGFGNVLWFDDG
jgi:hypothetical protein